MIEFTIRFKSEQEVEDFLYAVDSARSELAYNYDDEESANISRVEDQFISQWEEIKSANSNLLIKDVKSLNKILIQKSDQIKSKTD